MVAMLLLAINLYLGLQIGDLNGLASQLRKSDDEAEREQILEELEPVQKQSTLHVLCGVVAALITVLVASITVTYFVGTSRWCREVVTMYQLDEAYVQRADSLKRRTFPWAVATMLTILLMIFLGAASQPTNPYWDPVLSVTPHLAAALGGMVLIGFSFFRQGVNMAENYEIIQEIMADVARIRQERGLDVESTA